MVNMRTVLGLTKHCNPDLTLANLNRHIICICHFRVLNKSEIHLIDTQFITPKHQYRHHNTYNLSLPSSAEAQSRLPHFCTMLAGLANQAISVTTPHTPEAKIRHLPTHKVARHPSLVPHASIAPSS